MSDKDRQRWDERWKSRSGETFEVHPLLRKLEEVLEQKEQLPELGSALDIACGRGQNTLYLASLGLSVLGLDISPVALDFARQEAELRGFGRRVRFTEVDLDDSPLPAESFDLVCVTRFLDRRLLPEIGSIITSGGLLLYATRHRGAGPSLHRGSSGKRDYPRKTTR